MVVAYNNCFSSSTTPPPPPPRKQCSSYETQFETMFQSFNWQESEQLAFTKPREPLWFVTNKNAKAMRMKHSSSLELLAELQRTLDAFGYERSVSQREFHRHMLKSIIPVIFRDDLDAHIDRLLRDFNCTEFNSDVLIITPRRHGKTWSVAMFIAACALVLSGNDQPFVISIFSTSKRASSMMLQLVNFMICRIPGGRESIIISNQEHLFLRGPNGPEDIRKIYSFPSRVEIRYITPLSRRISLLPHTHTHFFFQKTN